MRIIWMQVQVVALCLSGLTFSSELAAQGAHHVPCGEGEKFYPDGRIIVLGGRHFRLCNGSYSSDGKGGWTSLSVARESGIDSALGEKSPETRYKGSLRHETFKAGRPYALDQEVSVVSAGPIQYSIRVPAFALNESLAVVAEGRLPNNAVFYAAPRSELPEHSLWCNSPPAAPFAEDMFCRLTVTYQPGEDLYISQIFTNTIGFGLIGFGGAEFSLSNLPKHVRDLHRAFEALEVVPSAD